MKNIRGFFWMALVSALLGCGPAGLRAAEDQQAQFKRAQQLEAQKDYAGAEAIYSKLIDANPVEPTLYTVRGWVRHLQKNDKAALHDLDLADVMKPKDPAILFRRGQVHRSLDDPNKAIEDFKVVAAADPKNSRVRYELAMAYGRIARHREALGAINEAVAITPTSADWVMARSAIYERLGDGAKALADADLARTLTTDPKRQALIDQNRPRLAALAANPTGEIQTGGLLSKGRPGATKAQVSGATNPPASPVLPRVDPSTAISLSPAEKPAALEPGTVRAGEVNFAQDTSQRETPAAGSGTRSASARRSTPASFAPIQVPAPIDLSSLDAQQWAGVVAKTKEGMAMVYGELTPAQQKAFDKEWAPYFEFPCKEVLDYFQHLSPLVAEFVQVKEAYGRTALAADKAQVELVSALATEDAEEVVSISQNLKHFRGILASCTGRISQLAAEVAKLGPPPKALELKKQAKKHHAKIFDDILATDAAPTASIEGTWAGSSAGNSEGEDYTYKIEAQLAGDLLLVRQNSDDPILLEPLPQGNAWLCVEIQPGRKPSTATLSRLEIRGGLLLRRIYEPLPAEALMQYRGASRAFQTKVYGPGTPPKSEGKPPALPATDDKGRPINWKSIYSDCLLARAAEIRVLRDGGLPAANESARRHEYATRQAKPDSSEFFAVVSRMALEGSIPESAVDQKQALTRTYERFMNEQYYYYGDNPPGFDNLRWFEVSIPVERGVRPDVAARARREGMLAWNLRKNLEVRFKRVERHQSSLSGLSLTPEGLAAYGEQKQKRIKAMREEIARLRAEQAAGSRPFSAEYYDQQVQELNRDIGKLSSDDYVNQTRAQIAKAQKQEEADYMLPARMMGIIAQLDKELPTTKGRSGLSNAGVASTAGGTSLELVESLQEVAPDKKFVAALADAAPPPAPAVPPAAVAAEAKKAAEELAKKEAAKLEQQTKDAKKAFLKEEIASNLRSIEVLERSLAATETAAMSATEKDKERNNLQRSIQQLRSWNQTAEDNIRFVDTGVYERTRTPSDEMNAQLMREDSRAQANYWDNINNKIARMNRLIDTAAPEVRDDLRRRWNDDLEAEIKSGAKFEKIDAAARAIGDAAIKSRQGELAQANKELAVTERNLAIAEGVKTTANYAMTAVTMYATAGLASPVSIFMPACAETAISTTYSIATGYIEGGPEAAFKQAAGAYSQAAGLFNTAMEAYQQGVLDHLEDYARDPRNKKLNETGAGLSAMGWALAKEGMQNAATHFVVNPVLANTKEALKGPAKFATGAFGKEPITFKSAAQMAEERRFNDKSLYGKHLMTQFKQAHEEFQTAKTSGKSPAELSAAQSRMDAAYKQANSDFHAKNWMKRTAKLNEDLGAAWSATDSVHKAELMKVTAELNRADGLSTPPIRSYSNSASKGGVGMDLDLGFEEPARWKTAPDPKNPGKTISVVNPEYWQWRNKLRLTDPATGTSKPISPAQYSAKAHENMLKAYEKVYGHKPDEAFLEFTYADHPEAYKDKAWLGSADKGASTPWADFANVNPAWAQQAADVTAFKIYRLQNADPKAGATKKASSVASGTAAGAAASKETFPGMPRYSAMLEQCRGLVKDFDTKMIGAKANTAEFGNEAGNKITINPESPLAKTPPAVQKHFLELRTVLNDFANGRIRPSEAEMKLNLLTGGQGIVEIPEQMRAVMNRFAQEQARK